MTGRSASKIVSEYDQEIPQSQTADNPVAGPVLSEVRVYILVKGDHGRGRS